MLSIRHARVGLGWLFALGATSVFFAFFVDAVSRFGWDASLVGEQPWRYVTCHFVHLSRLHLVTNLVALVLLAWSVMLLPVQGEESESKLWSRSGAVSIAMVGGWVGISLGLRIDVWPIDWYVGLSGLLYGVVGGILLLIALDSGRMRLMAGVLLIACTAKIGVDIYAGIGTIGVSGVPVATPVHLYGYLGGLFGVATHQIFLRWRAP